MSTTAQNLSVFRGHLNVKVGVVEVNGDENASDECLAE